MSERPARYVPFLTQSAWGVGRLNNVRGYVDVSTLIGTSSRSHTVVEGGFDLRAWGELCPLPGDTSISASAVDHSLALPIDRTNRWAVPNACPLAMRIQQPLSLIGVHCQSVRSGIHLGCPAVHLHFRYSVPSACL
jgi:hypothetical protein